MSSSKPANSPTVFDAPGPFKATFTGDLSLRIRDTLKFTFAGRGAVKLSINNSVVLENSGDDLSNKTSDDVKLLKGKNAFQLEYTSPPSGNAELRTYWLSKDFSAEPIPPTQFTHNLEDKALVGGTRLRNGRMLFATLRCNKCHTGPELKDAVMPELESDAPNLTEVGARLNPAWIAAWIKNPKSQRPTATMPRVITGKPANEARLTSKLPTSPPISGVPLGTPVEVNIPSDDQTISAGGHLFTALGCIACHLAPDSKVDDPTRIPLSVAKLKYRPAALKAFLLAPEKNYAWIRMPNFRLSDTEATAITAYLLANGPVKLPAIKGNPEAGKLSFTSAGCLNCHTAGDAKPAHRDVASLTVAMQNSFRGCLAATPEERRAAPDFGFSMQDRIDVTTFYTQYLDTLKREDPADLAERQVAALNCLACHTRDKAGDPWAGLVDEARGHREFLCLRFPKIPTLKSSPLINRAQTSTGSARSSIPNGWSNSSPARWILNRAPICAPECPASSTARNSSHPVSPPSMVIPRNQRRRRRLTPPSSPSAKNSPANPADSAASPATPSPARPRWPRSKPPLPTSRS